jgi:hypothetical protein
MKTDRQRNIGLLILLGASITSAGLAQPFDAGSTGADGPLNITSNTTLALPPSGIFNFTTISVAAGTTLSFTKNALNTPVHLLATSNVTINGTIDVSGSAGSSTAGGKGGPGGFDGGYPGLDANTPPGAGYGPGGAQGGGACCGVTAAGAGGYAGLGGQATTTNKGAAYGSPLLMPLAGGSGGGGMSGNPGNGGGGGGGAILIASSTRIDIISPGRILANGGGGCYNDGSGGAIRLLAPLVTGNGSLSANSGCSSGGSAGRIRIDTTNRRAVTLSSAPVASIGANMASFPTPLPRLDVIEAAGTVISEGTGAPVAIQLPFGSTSNRTVTVQARDFNASVPINVVLTPDSGNSVTYPATIDNQSANPAQTVVNVTVPVNVLVTIHAWTR